MLLTSQTRINGAGEVKRLGTVTAEYTIDEKTYKAILAEMSKYEEIRTPALQKEIDKAKQTVTDQLTKKAEALGANAIIDLNIYHEIINYGKMMMIAGTGTAAHIEETEE